MDDEEYSLDQVIQFLIEKEKEALKTGSTVHPEIVRLIRSLEEKDEGQNTASD